MQETSTIRLPRNFLGTVGRIVETETTSEPKHIWLANPPAARQPHARYLALFNHAVDSKLQCGAIFVRSTRKRRSPRRCSPPPRDGVPAEDRKAGALRDHRAHTRGTCGLAGSRSLRAGDWLFPRAALGVSAPHDATQRIRLVDQWVALIGLDPRRPTARTAYGERRSHWTITYWQHPCLPTAAWHTNLESTVRTSASKSDDALILLNRPRYELDAAVDLAAAFQEGG